MTLDDKLAEYNDGQLRGAAARLAEAVGATPGLVSRWRSGVMPGEQYSPKICSVLGITEKQLREMVVESKKQASAETRASVLRDEILPYGAQIQNVPVVGVVGAAEFMFNFDDPPLEMLPVVIEGSGSRRYAAFRISGDCMEPRFHDGEIVIIGETETVPDGVPGVFCLDAHCTLKIPKRNKDHVELRPLNPKFKSIIVKSNKMRALGVVVGVWRKP